MQDNLNFLEVACLWKKEQKACTSQRLHWFCQNTNSASCYIKPRREEKPGRSSWEPFEISSLGGDCAKLAAREGAGAWHSARHGSATWRHSSAHLRGKPPRSGGASQSLPTRFGGRIFQSQSPSVIHSAQIDPSTSICERERREPYQIEGDFCPERRIVFLHLWVGAYWGVAETAAGDG